MCVHARVWECWCQGAGNYLWQLFESQGSSRNPAYRAAWSLVKTVPHSDSAHLWALACFAHKISEFCLSVNLFVWLQSHDTIVSKLIPVLSSVVIWVERAYSYLRPEHWRSCSELQPEHKQRNPQQAHRRRREQRQEAVGVKLVNMELVNS